MKSKAADGHESEPRDQTLKPYCQKELLGTPVGDYVEKAKLINRIIVLSNTLPLLCWYISQTVCVSFSLTYSHFWDTLLTEDQVTGEGLSKNHVLKWRNA